MSHNYPHPIIAREGWPRVAVGDAVAATEAIIAELP
jgi:hypothetical protein